MIPAMKTYEPKDLLLLLQRFAALLDEAYRVTSLNEYQHAACEAQIAMEYMGYLLCQNMQASTTIH